MTNHDDITKALAGFESIKLEQAKLIKLDDRVDHKYILHISFLSTILIDCKQDYNLVEINGKNWAGYNNLYYDTKNYTFYHQHHSGKLNRFKIRTRTYIETGQRFLEIKFKTNKGRTSKKRLEVNSEGIDKPCSDFIRQQTGIDPADLIPTLLVTYNRITLIKKDNEERITIDTDITFAKNGKKTSVENIAIIEIKQNINKPSILKNILHLHNINEDTLSKYCMGIVQLVPNIKCNLFKEKLLAIQKIIEHGHRIS